MSDSSHESTDDELDSHTCVICYARKKSVTLPCAHRFCTVCIASLPNEKCPLCTTLIEFCRVDGEPDSFTQRQMANMLRIYQDNLKEKTASTAVRCLYKWIIVVLGSIVLLVWVILFCFCFVLNLGYH